MKTKIENLGEQVETIEDALKYRASLLEDLAPDPKEWKFMGEIYDVAPKGKCACGHPIRWAFVIERNSDGKREQLGSTCINHFQDISPVEFEKLAIARDGLVQKLIELDRKSKEAKQNTKIAELKTIFDETVSCAVEKYWEYRNRHELVPKPLWYAVTSYYALPRICEKEYIRKVDYIRFYEKNIQLWQEVIS